MTNIIKTITIIPKNEKVFKYYINGDLVTSYILRKHKMYLFLCTLIESSQTGYIYSLLSSFQKFIYNVETKKVTLLINTSSDKLLKKRHTLKDMDKIKRSQELKNSKIQQDLNLTTI